MIELVPDVVVIVVVLALEKAHDVNDCLWIFSLFDFAYAIFLQDSLPFFGKTLEFYQLLSLSVTGIEVA